MSAATLVGRRAFHQAFRRDTDSAHITTTRNLRDQLRK
jgi:hypothetical protein